MTMIEFDRRTVVTGLAAVAVVGVTPALPIRAAPLERSGLIFRRGSYALGWSEAYRQTALSERWHFQQWDYPDRTICHCATRLMFTLERGRTDGVELIRAAGATAAPCDEAELDLIGHAARVASYWRVCADGAAKTTKAAKALFSSGTATAIFTR
jgi:hypothetical protein